MLGDLSSPAAVRNWLDLGETSSSDPLLQRLLSAASRYVLNYCNRDIVYLHTVNETYDGYGNQFLLLRQFPVVDILSLTINGNVVPASTGFSVNGYVLEQWDGVPPGAQQKLSLRGFWFSQGMQNVSISYRCGYYIKDEAVVTPATDPAAPAAPAVVQVAAPFGAFAVDGGITLNGTPLTKITTGNVTSGQYKVLDTVGQYQVWATASPQTLLVSYSYNPFDLESAVIELVGEKFKYKDRIGQTTKSLGGQETASFTQKDMHDNIKTILRQYARVVP